MTVAAPSLEPYQLRLPTFEGPLDLLLRLIERQELDITAIALASVTDQFLARLDQLPDRDPAVLAEFATIAARLLLLKTRMLFPRPVVASPDGAVDDADELIQHLQEYRRLKAAAGLLAARDGERLRAYAPLVAPTPDTLTASVTLAAAGPADLLRAVHQRLARLPAPPRLLTLPPRISVGEMAARLLARLRGAPGGEVRFSTLARQAATRVDVVTAFMAILELMRRRHAEAEQAGPFGDIVVRRIGGDVASAASMEVADD